MPDVVARPAPAAPTAELDRPAPLWLVMAGIAGVIAWLVFLAVRRHVPASIRFAGALPLFVLGPASLVLGPLFGMLALVDEVIVLAALGVGISPAVADLLGRLHAIAVFPYLAAIGTALFVTRAFANRRRRICSAGDGTALLVLLALALLTGGIVFAHRVATNANGVTVFGDYDSVDLSYYAAITGELTHHIPPMAPFYSGHPLNYSWYPQMLLALVHRFADVPTLLLYYRYAWPALLALGALAGFVFVRSIASTGVALLAMTLLLVGGDFSYFFVWLLRPATYLFDWLLWPTNFLAPTMEVLHFSTWTPSLPVLFGGMFVMARHERDGHRAATLVLSALAFALLVQFKPFAFAVVMAGLGAAIVMPGADRATRRRYVSLGALTALFALPFLYQIVTMYAESRGHLKIDYFLLPRTMLDKLALAGPVNAIVGRVVPAGALQATLVLALATMVFFVGGLGVRWAGVSGVVHDARSPSAGAVWRLLAWIAIAGVAIPFVIVTDPYQDTLQFYQTALFVLWMFAARAVLGWRGPAKLRAALVALTIALAVPSSLHYLAEKSGDGPNHPLVHLSRSELAVADYLRTLNPDTTVMLHDRPLDPSLLVVTTERRAVLAWARYVTGSEARRREVDRFFASAERDPQVVFDVLRQYRVTHVIERPERDRINATVLGALRPVLRFPDVVLYEVPPGYN